jgi:alpha-tubulin suppressor-like RCC1 family protein
MGDPGVSRRSFLALTTLVTPQSPATNHSSDPTALTEEIHRSFLPSSNTFSHAGHGHDQVYGHDHPSSPCREGSFALESDVRLVSVAAGGRFACALRTDGNIACWGKNTHGEATPPSS